MLSDIHRLALNYIPEYVDVEENEIVKSKKSKKSVSFTYKIDLSTNDQIQAIIDKWSFTKNFGDDLKLSWTPTTITITGTPIHKRLKVKWFMSVNYKLDGKWFINYLVRIKYCRSSMLN